MIFGDFIDQTLFVIVIYEVEVMNAKTVRCLKKAAEKMGMSLDLFVYDNSKKSKIIDKSNFLNIKYYHDRENPGVSRAYNTAARYAKSKEKKYLMLLDQDTELGAENLFAYQKGATTEKLVAPSLIVKNKIYSPCRYFIQWPFHFKKPKYGAKSLKYVNFLNSGLLLDLSAFLEVGGYREDIPLYFSDFEFVNRFKKLYSNFYWAETEIFHDLSDVTQNNPSAAKKRFDIYCGGAVKTSTGRISFFCLFLVCFKRCLSLVLQYRDVEFFKVFFQSFLKRIDPAP